MCNCHIRQEGKNSVDTRELFLLILEKSDERIAKRGPCILVVVNIRSCTCALRVSEPKFTVGEVSDRHPHSGTHSRNGGVHRLGQGHITSERNL